MTKEEIMTRYRKVAIKIEGNCKKRDIQNRKPGQESANTAFPIFGHQY